jgi:hypothetical protein
MQRLPRSVDRLRHVTASPAASSTYTRRYLAGAGLTAIGVAIFLGCSTEPPASTTLSINAGNDAGVDATRVLPPSATNQLKDGDETDIDCGGKVARACVDGRKCSVAQDCTSQVGAGGICAGPTATDGVKNGDETDVDCGGLKAPACMESKRCALPRDCISASCTGKVCQVATNSDGIKNGSESGIDCGGATSSVVRCAAGGGCAVATDCISAVCTQSSCQVASHTDGVKNGNETGADCGGPDADSPRCAVAALCAADSDCASKNCAAASGACAAAAPNNGKQDGDETAIDCGGSGAPKCAVGKTCLVAGDCLSDGCGYKGTCVSRRRLLQSSSGDRGR